MQKPRVMRFTVEERHLTDANGRPVHEPEPAFHSCDADNVDDAVRAYVDETKAELIGDVLKFPGLQAVATARKATGVYTLHFMPSSQRNLPAL